jgi:hypothetical protein
MDEVSLGSGVSSSGGDAASRSFNIGKTLIEADATATPKSCTLLEGHSNIKTTLTERKKLAS